MRCIQDKTRLVASVDNLELVRIGWESVLGYTVRPVYTGDFCRGNSMQFLSHQVSNMLETPAISRRQIAVRIAPGLHVRF